MNNDLSSEISQMLDKKTRDELNIIARKLRIKRVRQYTKEQLLAEISKVDKSILRKHLNITWWDKYHNHTYGIVTVVSLLLTVLFFMQGEKSKIEELNERLTKSIAVIRAELQSNLQISADIISWTENTSPELPLIPRKLGETKDGFEDRVRRDYSDWLEYLSRYYEQRRMSNDIYASQKTIIPQHEDRTKNAIKAGYGAIEEINNRLILYQQFLGDLLPLESDSRIRSTESLQRENLIELHIQWFEILGSWLLLEPGAEDLNIIQTLVLPQIDDSMQLRNGVEGWRLSKEKVTQLWKKKGDIARSKLKEIKKPVLDKKAMSEESLSDLLEKATFSFMEGKSSDTKIIFEEIVKHKDLTEDVKKYAIESVRYLESPEIFDSVKGAYIMRVEDGGLGASAGLRKGDVIVRYNGMPVSEAQQLSTLIATSKQSSTVAIEFIRDGLRMGASLPGGRSLSLTCTPLVAVFPANL